MEMEGKRMNLFKYEAVSYIYVSADTKYFISLSSQPK